MEDFVNSINKKIENIEYKDIKEIRSEVQSVKVDLAKNNILVTELKETLSSISEAMLSVRDTMVQLNKSNEELTNNLRQQNEKIDRIQDKNEEEFKSIREQINENDNKTKFDISLFIKHNFVNIIVGIGMTYYLFFK